MLSRTETKVEGKTEEAAGTEVVVVSDTPLLDRIMRESPYGPRRMSPKSARKAERKAKVAQAIIRLRLSDLILEGSKKTGPVNGWLELPDPDTSGGEVRACTLGAAYYAHVLLTVRDREERKELLTEFEEVGMVLGGGNTQGAARFIERFPVLKTKVECPVRGCEEAKRRCGVLSLMEAVVHLNDDHNWKREKVARWVEDQERRLRYRGRQYKVEGGESDAQ